MSEESICLNCKWCLIRLFIDEETEERLNNIVCVIGNDDVVGMNMIHCSHFEPMETTLDFFRERITR